MQLSSYTSCTLYCLLNTVYSDMETLTSDCLLLSIIAGSYFRYFCKCACWAILSVAAIAASWWTNWCLHCSSVSASGALEEAPIVLLDSYWIISIQRGRRAMTCCWGNGKEDYHERWKLLRNQYEATGDKGMNDCQLARSTQDTSYIEVVLATVPGHPALVRVATGTATLGHVMNR
jgi:hypothetical protein